MNDMLHTRLVGVLSAVVLALMFPSMSFGNQLRQLSFAKLASSSDLIAIGIVESVRVSTDEKYNGLLVATVKVENVLSGRALGRIEVFLSSEIAEESLGRLDIGGRYLLFLDRDKFGLYRPVNGPYSAIEMGRDCLKAEPAR